jgi:hypothetical protein
MQEDGIRLHVPRRLVGEPPQPVPSLLFGYAVVRDRSMRLQSTFRNQAAKALVITRMIPRGITSLVKNQELHTTVPSKTEHSQRRLRVEN